MKFCPLCNEAILRSELASPLNNDPRGGHYECVMRSVIGSVGHQRGECHCFGKEDTSEVGLSYREAAKRAVEEWKRLQATATIMAGN